ncbi:MAG TPA: toprim domain-containing protein, partial [Tissierellaceae bacterium]|nr:toprim domain-containing protein [Tissierellaceae bacterium]
MNFKDWEASLAEGKNPCYKCRQSGRDEAGDNLFYYGEGEGYHCFSCGWTKPSDDFLEELEELEPQEYEYMATEWNEELYNQIKENSGVDSKNYRGIRTDISATLGVRYEYDTETGEVAKTFYPVTKGCLEKEIKDSLCGLKIREHPKKFYSVGSAGSDCDLFMQWKFRTHRGILVITAGEIDAMSAYQMLYDMHQRSGNAKKYDEIAVVSSTIGEGGTAKQVRQQYQWVDQFSKIIVLMDNDEAGRKATEEVVNVLPKGKAFVADLRYKDINEYLERGDEQAFINDFWGHRPYTLDGVKSSFDGFLEIEEEILKPRIPLPKYMHKLQENTGGGLARGAIHNIIAATGVSKTTHLRQIVYHMIMYTDLKPTIISLEETAARYNLELLQLHAGENFTFGKTGEEIIDYISTDRMVKLRQELIQNELGEPRYYIIDERSGDIKSIEKQMDLMYNKFGSEVFVIDVLSDLLRGSI